MPLFKPRQESTPATKFPRASEPTCFRHNCPDPAVTDCCYVDGAETDCATSWCLSHLETISDHAYCARHAGVMRVLSVSALAGHRPPVSNRAASLVNWVANDLDERIQRTLENVAGTGTGATVVSDPLEYVVDNVDEAHVWCRVWRIWDPPHERLRVTLDAVEARDYEVRLWLGDHRVSATVPSWVLRHMERRDVSNEQDRAERAEYYAGLVNRLNFALDQLRDLRSRP